MDGVQARQQAWDRMQIGAMCAIVIGVEVHPLALLAEREGRQDSARDGM